MTHIPYTTTVLVFCLLPDSDGYQITSHYQIDDQVDEQGELILDTHDDSVDELPQRQQLLSTAALRNTESNLGHYIAQMKQYTNETDITLINSLPSISTVLQYEQHSEPNHHSNDEYPSLSKEELWLLADYLKSPSANKS